MVEYKTLNNGLIIVDDFDTTSRLCNVGIFIRGGSVADGSNSGIAHFLEHIVYATIKKRTEKSNKVSIINAYTGREFTAYNFTATSDMFEFVFNNFMDAFSNPDFSLTNINEQKKVIEKEIMFSNETQRNILIEQILDSLYENKKISSSITGSVDSLNEITQDNLITYYQNNYVPSKMVISVSGGVDMNRFLHNLNACDMIKNSDDTCCRPHFDYNDLDIIRKQNSNRTIKEMNTQILLNKNYIAPHLSDVNEARIFKLVSILIGGGIFSDIFNKIQKEKGLSYCLYSKYIPYSKWGFFTISVALNLEDLETVESTLKEIIRHRREKGITDNELLKIKALYKLQFLQQIENSYNVMEYYAKQLLFGEKAVNADEELFAVSNITKSDVNFVIQKYLSE